MSLVRSVSWIVAILVATVACPSSGARYGTTAVTPTAADASGAILFTSNRESSDSLYLVNSDGTGLKRLVAGSKDGTWSPDGSALAFVRRWWNGKKNVLAIADAKGGKPRQLAENVDQWSFEWSPDGTRIVYSTGDTLGVVRADGTGKTMIARGDARGDASYPVWSPDSRKIAFIRTRDSDDVAYDDVYVVNADGTDERVLVPNAYSPQWSPDGAMIVFVRVAQESRTEERYDLYVADADGANQRVLVPNAYSPQWSPDGSKIAFERPTQDFKNDLYVAGADGSGVRKLTPSDAQSVDARWSPDSQKIAFSIDNYGKDKKAFVANADGSGLRLLDRGGVGPIWSPDATRLALQHGKDIWVVAGDGSERYRATTGGERYGYQNVPLQFHPRGVRTGELRGTAVSPEVPTDSVVTGSTLRSPYRISELSADGTQVAVGYDSEQNCIELWRANAARVTTFFTGCGLGWSTLLEEALAGSRAAWLTYDQGNHFYAFLEVASPDSAPSTVANIATGGNISCVTASCDWAGMGDLHGDGSLLVFDTWRQKGGPCESVDCFREDKVSGTLWRIVGKRAVRVRSERVGLTALAVDGGLIAIKRSDGPIELLRASGALVRTFAFAPSEVRAAALSGKQLLVQRKSAVSVYDIRTGRMKHAWPLAARGQLADAAGGIAVYVAGASIHLLRLSDGRELTIRVSGKAWTVHAQIEQSGLFYSYTAPKSKMPGRVAFVPFRDLLRRLR